MPQKQKPRGRLWLNDGSCVRLRPERPNHVWAYDFVSAFTHDGRIVRFLNLIDEYTRECLAIHVGRRINGNQVIEVLAEAMIDHAIPDYIRSDNGPEFVARALYASGWQKREPALSTSNPVLPGRTDTAKASTPKCATNFRTARSSIR